MKILCVGSVLSKTFVNGILSNINIKKSFLHVVVALQIRSCRFVVLYIVFFSPGVGF